MPSVSIEPSSFPAAGEEWIQGFMTALKQDNVDLVVTVLSEDVILVSDGEGKAIATTHPIESRSSVICFLLDLIRKTYQDK